MVISAFKRPAASLFVYLFVINPEVLIAVKAKVLASIIAIIDSLGIKNALV